MRKYEMTYLISDEVEEGNLNKVTGKIAGYISDFDGNVKKEDIWGRRKLAYPIKKEEFATYVTINFELPQDKLKEFESNLKHTTGILRHLLIVRDYGDEIITLTKDEIAKTEEIEEVIGGEKSFEAVQGETEESRDLMAKREEEPETETTEEKVETEKEAQKEEKVKELKKAPEKTEKEEKEKEAKPALKKEAKKEKTEKKDNSKDEVERLSKLNEELDDILKDEL